MIQTAAPVVLFAYNRPDHLQRTLETLAEAEGARETELWIFCDGTKLGQATDRIEAVLAVVQDPHWVGCFADVHVTTAKVNKGLARSIIDGVSMVMDAQRRAIVLEDDLLVASDFLTFMNACLDYYRDDDRVGSITGFCPLSQPPVGYSHDIMMVPRNCSHGWATWSDRWSDIDWDARDAARVWRDPQLRQRMNVAGSDRLFRLRQQLRGKIDSWSIRFGLWLVISGRVTVYPVQNRVRNIGFDGSGVHTRAGQEINDSMGENLKVPHLEWTEEHPAVLNAFWKVYSGSFFGRMRRRILLTLEPLQPRKTF